MKQKIKVWDAPVRLFHWTLVLAIPFMWFSAETGGNWLAWHLKVGLLILGLWIFRISWGIWGSDTARFGQFVRGPRQIQRYIRGEITEIEQPGHNPLGALMVIALLGAVGLQVLTGLFAADENTFLNPGFLNGWVSEELGAQFRSFHVQFFWVIVALIIVHVATVMLYKFVKKNNLIHPMVTGYKYLENNGKLPELRFAPFWLLLGTVILAVMIVVWVYYQAS